MTEEQADGGATAQTADAPAEKGLEVISLADFEQVELETPLAATISKDHP